MGKTSINYQKQVCLKADHMKKLGPQNILTRHAISMAPYIAMVFSVLRQMQNGITKKLYPCFTTLIKSNLRHEESTHK